MSETKIAWKNFAAASPYRIAAKLALLLIISVAAAKADNAQPHNTQPHNTQPHNTQPHNAQPSNAQPSNAQPNNAQPSNAQPNNAQPSNAQPVATHEMARRTMSFPSDKSYGTIINLGADWSIFDKHPKGSFFAEAKGTIPYYTTDALMLTANFPFVDDVPTMSKLPPDAFQFINIDSLPSEDKIFVPLTHLTGLRRLDFQEGDFHDKAFGQLGKLPNLEVIFVKECFVTGESLTHFGSLKKLQAMTFKKCAFDWTLLSKSKTVFPALTQLGLTNSNVTDEGLLWLQNMPKLTKLFLDCDVKVTDKGLLNIKKLKQLRIVQLKDMKQLTLKGVMQLKGSNLVHIGLENSNFTPEEEKRIKDAMPGVNFAFNKRKVKADTIELFAPLH